MKENKYYNKIGSKSSRIEAEVVEKIQQGISLEEVVSSMGLTYYMINKIAKKHEIKIGKLEKIEDDVIDKIHQGIMLDELVTIFNTTTYILRKIAKKNNLKIGKISKNYKTKRNNEMLELIHAGDTFSSIAKKFNVTKSRVGQLAKDHGVNRWEIGRTTSEQLINDIQIDIDNGMEYDELKQKHNLTHKTIERLRYRGLKPVSATYRENRNSTIVDEYKIMTAKKVLASDTKSLDSPQRILGVNSIYSISTAAGFKRYPNIGKRCVKGSHETKEVLGLILTRRNIDKLSFRKIAEELNEKNMLTIGGLPFTTHNVTSKYHSQYK